MHSEYVQGAVEVHSKYGNSDMNGEPPHDRMFSAWEHGTVADAKAWGVGCNAKLHEVKLIPSRVAKYGDLVVKMFLGLVSETV